MGSYFVQDALAITVFPGTIIENSLPTPQTNYTADPNLVTYTPPAAAGTYRVSYQVDVASATSGIISLTISYTDSNGNAVSNAAMPLFQQGTAAPNTTFTTSAASRYSGNYMIDVNNAASKIIVKWVGGGTTTARATALIEQLN